MQNNLEGKKPQTSDVWQILSADVKIVLFLRAAGAHQITDKL